MSKFCSFEGFCVFNAVNDAIILHWHLLHSSLSGGNKFLGLYTGKKFCVREMAVEVGSSLVVLGATWGTLEFYPYNRDVAIIFLPTEYAASFSCSRVDCIWLSNGCIRQRCVVGSNSLNPGTETTVTTRCIDRNLLCSCVP